MTEVEAEPDSRDYVTAFDGDIPRPAAFANVAESIHSRSETVPQDGDSAPDSLNADEGNAPRLYLLGQRLLNDTLRGLMESLVQSNAASNESQVSFVDTKSRKQVPTNALVQQSQLASAINGFPFQEALQRLNALAPAQAPMTRGADPKETFMINIGALAQQNDENFKQQIINAIRDYGLRDVAADKQQPQLPGYDASGELGSDPPSMLGSNTEVSSPSDQDLQVARLNSEEESDSTEGETDPCSSGRSQSTFVESFYPSKVADEVDKVTNVNAARSENVHVGPRYEININFIDQRPVVPASERVCEEDSVKHEDMTNVKREDEVCTQNEDRTGAEHGDGTGIQEVQESEDDVESK